MESLRKNWGSRKPAAALCVLFLITIFGFTADVQAFSGGDGSAGDPCLVATDIDMQTIGGDRGRYWHKHFKMVNDVNLSFYTGASFNIIGDPNTPFTGVFDGNGHTISNFTYTTTASHIGLFGYVDDANAVIKNLRLIDANVDAGTGDYVGSLVGWLQNGTITDCNFVSGQVEGADSVGGLVGYNYDGGSISNCYATDSVNGADYVGGLVGENLFGTISNCYATDSVNGANYVGGLVGNNYDGSISNSYATGDVIANNNRAGGLVGSNNFGTVSNCYATGSATANNNHAGGLVGYNYYGSISSCYATGDANAFVDYAGGLVGGTDSGSTSYCYSRGGVSSGDGSYIGGLIGDGSTTVLISYWDVNTSGLTTSSGGTGKTTAQMKMESTYIGWGCDLWTIDDGNDYPHLVWENAAGVLIPAPVYAGGSGDSNDPYRIETAEQLNSIGLATCLFDKHFELIGDIDLSAYTGEQFNIIGNTFTSFTGVFDGNGHTISNFTYGSFGTNNIGLFGYVDDPCAVIKNVVLINANVFAGSGDNVGSLVGRLQNGTITDCNFVSGQVEGNYYVGGLVGQNNFGTISNCYATDSVNGDDYVGGLVGLNDSGSISNCYATDSVNGDDYVGGLVGLNNSGTISNSYATGSATANNNYAGGLVGYNSGSISNCYAIGDANATTNYEGGLIGYETGSGTYIKSFWNSESYPDVNGIGNTTDPNVIGKTTANMQTRSTFTDAGWDFLGETINGPNDFWDICEGLSYPKLSWQNLFSSSILILYVDYSATGANNGTSWADAFNHLQEALALAPVECIHEIWVAQGTYKPDANTANPSGTGDRDATFQLLNGVAIYGGYAGLGEMDPNARDIELYETILSGDLDSNDVDVNDPCDLLNESTRGENSFHVVTGSGTGPNTIFDGFTITAGNANTTGPHRRGSGMYNDSASPTIVSCTFIANSAYWYGGGIYNDNNSCPTVTDCAFSGNYAGGPGGGIYSDNNSNSTVTGSTFIGNWSDNIGGGIFIDSSNLTITGCTFSDNWAPTGGGLHYARSDSNSMVTNCTFIGNSALNGGGLANVDSSPTVTNCVFRGNSAGTGGGMQNRENSIPTVINCTFSGNSSSWGAGMYSEGSSPTVINCTFSDNSATLLGGGMYYRIASSPTLINSIVWGNTAASGNEIALAELTTLVVDYSDVRDGNDGIYKDGTSTVTWGSSNIDADPLFFDANNPDPNLWDYHIRPGSPCIDVGDNNSVPADTVDLDNNGNTSEPIPFDIDTDMRISGGTVDMGSDEAIWDIATDVNQGQVVTLNPGGGGFDPNEEVLVLFENVSGPNGATIEVTEVGTELYPDGLFSALGTSVRIETSLADGEFVMTVVIPFDANNLGGGDPFDVDLMYWDESETPGKWRHAVSANTQGPDSNSNRWEEEFPTVAAPALMVLKARGIGANGVFWNTVTKEGFVWANVDHTTDFEGLIHNVADFEPDGDVDFVDFAWFAPNWMDTACGVCNGADLTGDGNVGPDDLRQFIDNWLTGAVP